MRRLVAGRVPDALLASFVDTIITDADWAIWRSRLLLQVKMVRDGAAPAPGHEKGRGVGKP